MENKDFKGWYLEKNNIHENKIRLFFHEREVWFLSLGLNIGFEQDGKGKDFSRPIIIVKKFNNEVFWGVSVTGREKSGKYYFSFLMSDKPNTAILSQLRLIDAKRLLYKIGDITPDDFVAIKEKLRQFLA